MAAALARSTEQNVAPCAFTMPTLKALNGEMRQVTLEIAPHDDLWTRSAAAPTAAPIEVRASAHSSLVGEVARVSPRVSGYFFASSSPRA